MTKKERANLAMQLITMAEQVWGGDLLGDLAREELAVASENPLYLQEEGK